MAERIGIHAVLLDAGGVLLHPNLEWLRCELEAVRVSRSIDELHLAYYRMICAADAATSLDSRGVALTTLEIRVWMIERLLEGANLPPARVVALAASLARRAQQAFPREGDIYFWAMPGLRERLERLAAAGFALAVASNNDGSLEAQLEAVGVSDCFSHRLDSAVEGVSKPDPELLLRAASRLGVEPESCLYVGDIDRVDGAAARAAGMHFALLDPLAQPRASAPRMIPELDAIRSCFVVSEYPL